MLKVVFMGTSEFAVPILETTVAKTDVKLVITQPARPKGRGQKLTPTPVYLAAEKLGLKVITPEKVIMAKEEIKAIKPDLIILASYGQIIPKDILEIPKIGPLNVHPSLLPKYRGATPIQSAIMNGEKITGVTIMWMNELLDSGDIYLQESIEIDDEDTFGSLHAKLSELGAKLIEKAIDMLERGEIIRIKQKDEEATYTKPIRKEDTLINWEDSAERIVNKIRALSPTPGGVARIKNETYKIYRAKVVEELKGKPGEILVKDPKSGILVVAALDKAVSILEIQPENKKVMNVKEFLAGYGRKL